jgi:hypothetical protein
MKTLVKKGATPLIAAAITLFGWYPTTTRAATGEPRPFVKNLMSPTYRPTADQPTEAHRLTKKDIERLAAMAETSQDHARIAQYWEAEAGRLEAEASGYENAAAAIRRSPVVKNLAAPSTAARYEFVAKGFREQAKSDRTQAASHERMAKDVA